jgi:hypothetical protein
VDSTKLATLRTMLGLEDDAAPNAVLGAVIRHLESTRA